MEVVLLERVEKLGLMGDVVTVKPGFARNFLLPHGKALRATRENIAAFEMRKATLEADNLKRCEEARAIAGRMENLSIVLVRQASDVGHLYGSVNARDIALSVTGEGFAIKRGQVHLDRPIKVLGLHDVTVILHPEVKTTIVVNVARSEEDAVEQGKTGQAVTAEASLLAIEEDEDFHAAPLIEAESESLPGETAETPAGA